MLEPGDFVKVYNVHGEPFWTRILTIDKVCDNPLHWRFNARILTALRHPVPYAMHDTVFFMGKYIFKRVLRSRGHETSRGFMEQKPA